LAKTITEILPRAIKINSTHARDVHLATFTSLHSLFDRVPSDLPLQDAKVKEALEKLLFDATFEGLPEAMRQKRAEALVAIGKVKELSVWVAERAKVEAEGGERSAGVRAVLAKAGKKD
jgi:proteasome component ECM29